jgi:hypothetical protein
MNFEFTSNIIFRCCTELFAMIGWTWTYRGKKVVAIRHFTRSCSSFLEHRDNQLFQSEIRIGLNRIFVQFLYHYSCQTNCYLASVESSTTFVLSSVVASMVRFERVCMFEFLLMTTTVETLRISIKIEHMMYIICLMLIFFAIYMSCVSNRLSNKFE